MPKPIKIKRKVNRNLFYSKLYLQGLTLTSIGKMLDPPISRFRVHQIIYAGSPDYRLKEIVTILRTNVNTLFPKTNEEATRVE
jgi:hypothetical protein